MSSPAYQSRLSSLALVAITLGGAACASRAAEVHATAADPGIAAGRPTPRMSALADDFDSAKLAPDAQPAAAATVYACPMHPEVTSDKPGKCSKCGMDLEPKPGSSENEHGHDHHHGTP